MKKTGINEISRKDAIRHFLLKKLTNKQIAEVDALSTMIDDSKLTKEQESYLVYLRMKKLRRRHNKPIRNVEMCTLVQFPEGAIVGSGRCPNCKGFLGNQE